MEKLKEVLSIYDNPENKKFSYFDVSVDIKSLPEEVKQEFNTQAELLAFAFQDNTGQKLWNTYLGPFATWRRKDNGELVMNPDKSLITKEHIDYWEQRTSETKNPRMFMRYAGLVLDFKKNITGLEPDYRKIKIPYTEAVIDVVEGEYFEHTVEGYYYSERALEMASRFGANDLFERIQDVLWLYNNKVADDLSAGLWGRQFEMMLKYIDKYGKYEDKIVEENENRFDRLEKNALENANTSDKYAHPLNELTELLCQYYTKRGVKEAVKSHLDRLLDVTRLSFKIKGGMWSQAMLQQMQSLYRKFHLYTEANKLYIEIQDQGENALNSMTRQEFSIPIDNNQLNSYMEDFVKGTPREVIIRFLVWNTPNMKIERQRQKEEAEQSPIMDLVRTVSYDSEGTPINNIGVGDDAENQKLMFGMYRRMQISSMFLRLEMMKMEENNILDKEKAMALFDGSPLIQEGQTSIVKKGIEAYFEKDYLVCCHLLIPQFEAAIRRLVALCGGEILRTKRNDKTGNEYISLDGLLDSDEANKYLGEDVNTYFKNLFTDQYGWNLRNLTSHGLMKADCFNSTVADRLMHAFLLLSQLDVKKEKK